MSHSESHPRLLSSDAVSDRLPLRAWLAGATPVAAPDDCAGLLPGNQTRHWSLDHGFFADYGRVLVADDAPGSQFDGLMSWLRKTPLPPRPVLALALAGRGFHGYRGRPWCAMRGNLHLSAVFSLDRALGSSAVALTAIPAVAVMDALGSWRTATFQPGIKWVNDIVLGGKKIAGVITATQSSGARIHNVVFGIGLNLTEAPEVEPSVFVPATGCLRQALGGDSPGLERMFPAVASALAGRVREFLAEGPAPILEAYRRSSMLTGRAVRVWEEATVNTLSQLRQTAPPRRGVVAGIGDDLSLWLAGDARPVERGRLAMEEACRVFGLPD